MGSWAKALVALLAAIAVGTAGALILAAADGGHVKEDPSLAAEHAAAHDRYIAALEAERAELKANRRGASREQNSHKIEPASAGTNGTPGQSAAQSTGQQSGSFGQLESEVSGEIGVAYAPLGSSGFQQLGRLEVGHAWSSFKVPIVVSVMLEEHGSLTSEQESMAASAITASDNAAAASLFNDLEATTHGAASQAIESVLSQVPGGATQVATAPPPPGAVSSWGQTEWTLSASSAFYGALACGQYGPADNVVALMEQVVPEQQWGLGQANFPAGTRVAYKAGWGPDGSESGPYLVRQAGILRAPSGTGAVVTIAAQDSSGSFEAGVADLNRVADWVAENVPLGSGSC
ncbi:MAG: hypothetical protein QOE56_238 [Solirubrobacterales bacterium]|jgi:hypothetical protein|nr:hypothetical protein [Solirubrobacterales bacterium]